MSNTGTLDNLYDDIVLHFSKCQKEFNELRWHEDHQSFKRIIYCSCGKKWPIDELEFRSITPAMLDHYIATFNSPEHFEIILDLYKKNKKDKEDEIIEEFKSPISYLEV